MALSVISFSILRIQGKKDYMILSMTGYGKSSAHYLDKVIGVEIKSLNGKSSDIRMRLPNNIKEKEIILRKRIIKSALRGKFDFTLKIGSESGGEEFSLNKELFKKYATEIKSIQDDLGGVQGDLLQAIMRIPNVVGASEGELDEGEWKVIEQVTDEALQMLHNFRKQEGNVLKDDLETRVNNIHQSLKSVEPMETARITALRERMHKNLDQFMNEENVDKNRFEQEVLFYLEKLDITEEKVRLAQHCEYFLNTLNNEDTEKGKKLAFISQEIGREINTLGAKAQQSDIQQLVVTMKDELEKIKEQLANII